MIKKEEFCHPRDESKTVCSDQSIHGANVNGDDIDDKNYDDEEFMCVCVCVCVCVRVCERSVGILYVVDFNSGIQCAG